MPNKHFCQGPHCHTNPTTDRFLKSKGIILGRYAYASGALVQCRKVGAKNWGNSTKKSDDLWKDWVSCASCEDDKKGTEPCGRKDASKGTKRRCRPTCSACKDYKKRGGKPKKRKAGTFSREEKEGLHGWFKRRG